MEIAKEAKVTIVDMKCGNCFIKNKSGVMRLMEGVDVKSLDRYPHRCNVCNNLEVYDKVYPYIQIEQEDLNEKDILYHGQIRNR